MVQGYKGVNININTRDDEESLGETHMKDYILMSLIKRTRSHFILHQSLSLARLSVDVDEVIWMLFLFCEKILILVY